MTETSLDHPDRANAGVQDNGAEESSDLSDAALVAMLIDAADRGSCPSRDLLRRAARRVEAVELTLVMIGTVCGGAAQG